MREIRTNPFKPNDIENNPSAFGLRSKEIVYSIETLFNENNLFITGARGIGKSSLGLQLQKILSGENTLLERCNIKSRSESTLCIFYACGKETTIEEICLDILYELENEVLLLPDLQLKKLKPTIELNFGMIKAKFESEIESTKRSPASIANRFVNGLRIVYEKAREFNIFSGINIMIDEVDQLNESINFGHFIKVIHETLNNRNCTNITFIFAGQLGSFSRFNDEDPSFERLVKCVPLDKLSWEASEYILDYASIHSKPRFSYEVNAKNLILSMASGYPYILHLIGDSCFKEIIDSNKISIHTVLNALENILLTDKREKFTEKLKQLDEKERNILFYIAHYKADKIPSEIPFTHITGSIPTKLIKVEEIDSILSNLENKGILYSKRDKSIYLFSEELFRVFISYIRIEMENSDTSRKEFDESEEKIELLAESSMLDSAVSRIVATGEVDEKEVSNLSMADKRKLFKEYINSIPSNYSNAWEEDEFILGKRS